MKMSHLGLGVMIGLLAGNDESAKVFSEAIGKVISKLEITNSELEITLADNTKIRLFDNGQSCCEHRYMHTDDDLDYYAGATLLGAEVRPGPEETSEYDEVKESEFLIVQTSLGEFTIVNYNEHNGYYGGFLIRACKVAG